MRKNVFKLLGIIFMAAPLSLNIGDDITPHTIEVRRAESETETMYSISYETNSEEILQSIDSIAKSVTNLVSDVEVLSEIVEERTAAIKEYFYNLVYIPETAALGTNITFGVGDNQFLTLKYVSIGEDGALLTPDESGIYSFIVEGDTKLYLDFEVNSTLLLKEFVNIPKDKWSEILTVENVLLFVQFLLTTLFSSGYFIALYKSKKVKAQTANEISNAVESTVNDTVKNVLDKFLADLFKTTVENISEKTDGIAETMQVMARCFALSQEGTPESRLAIMEELTKLKTNEAELSDKIKNIINEAIENNNKIQEEKMKTLEELKEANDKIDVVNETSEGDDYGVL